MKRIKPDRTVLVLLHYPITNRAGETIATSVTNLDIHDLARSARTYEVDHYYIVTPLEEQRVVVGRIIGHWKGEGPKSWHPDRFEALSRIELVSDFESVKADLKSRYPSLPQEVVMPDARPLENQISYFDLKSRWQSEVNSGVKIIVLGTGYGIDQAFFPEVHTFLAPIYGPFGREGYNHLSVRAAGAIILDRLLSDVSGKF